MRPAPTSQTRNGPAQGWSGSPARPARRHGCRRAGRAPAVDGRGWGLHQWHVHHPSAAANRCDRPYSRRRQTVFSAGVPPQASRDAIPSTVHAPLRPKPCGRIRRCLGSASTPFAAGKSHAFKIKTIRPLRWRPAGKKHNLRLIVIAPLGYRLTKHSRMLYRKPAFLICTDPDAEDSADFFKHTCGDGISR
jgi:hypothetical protein